MITIKKRGGLLILSLIGKCGNKHTLPAKGVVIRPPSPLNWKQDRRHSAYENNEFKELRCFGSFIAFVCLSAWLSVGCIIAGQPRNAMFKPLTLLLLLLLAWQAPMFDAIGAIWCWQGCAPHSAGRCANPVATSTSDVRHRRVFFLSHLLYTIYFASQMTLSFFWPLPLVLLVLGALLLAIIWTRLEEYRWPICTFIGMTLVMVWLAVNCGSSVRPARHSLRLLALHCCLSVTLSGWVATIAAASGQITRLLRPATLPVISLSSARRISDSLDFWSRLQSVSLLVNEKTNRRMPCRLLTITARKPSICCVQTANHGTERQMTVAATAHVPARQRSLKTSPAPAIAGSRAWDCAACARKVEMPCASLQV